MKNVATLFLITLFLTACYKPVVENPAATSKPTPMIVVYYSPILLNGGRRYLPSTPDRIRKESHKVVKSKVLNQKLNSIIQKGCMGGAPQDNMSIMAQTNLGNIGIHQDKTVTFNNKKLCDVSYSEVDTLVKLMELKPKFYPHPKNK